MTVVCNKKYERERSIDEIAEVLRKELDNYPEIIDYQCTVGGGYRDWETCFPVFPSVSQSR